MNIITLSWPNFNTNVSKIHTYFKNTLSNNYDGLTCSQESLILIFKSEIIESDTTLVNVYWNSITAQMFLPTADQIISMTIGAAMNFGTGLLNQYATQNVLSGITQAGKTKPVMDYCHELNHCLMTGSLYAARDEIIKMIADESEQKQALFPFIKNDILYIYLNKLETYLNIPLTQNN